MTLCLCRPCTPVFAAFIFLALMLICPGLPVVEQQQPFTLLFDVSLSFSNGDLAAPALSVNQSAAAA